jgi:hypothetical protein
MHVFQPLTRRRPLISPVPHGAVRVPPGLTCRGDRSPLRGAVLLSGPGRTAAVVESFTRTVSRRVQPYSDQVSDLYRTRRHDTYSDEVLP